MTDITHTPLDVLAGWLGRAWIQAEAMSALEEWLA
jgi:hypothetical protein